ncbi:MAG: hypothetical protein U0793_12710 [Gemmataceae bacterium]
MKRVFVFLVLVLSPPRLAAQWMPAPVYPSGAGSYGPCLPPRAMDEFRAKRGARERMVAALGLQARRLVEAHDEAVAALSCCSRPVGLRFCESYNAGVFNKCANMPELLRVIAMPGHGDDVAIFAMSHANELNDFDMCSAYLVSPLDYAMRLKTLEQGATEMRAVSFASMPKPTANKGFFNIDGIDNRLGIGLGIGAVILCFLAWKRRWFLPGGNGP